MKGVQLITYPNSLGGDLSALNELLTGPLEGLFPGGVHVLPPFPSTADRGFAPVTYRQIDPAFGSWEDIRRLASERPVLLDLMVNHVSRRSDYFQDVLRNGEASQYADMFITLDKVWPDGVPKEEDLGKIFLRRRRPYSEYAVGDSGRTLRVWTTFGKTDPSDQIDIDVHSEAARRFISRVFRTFAENGVSIVRLDAVAYVTKRAGTSCFFVEPEIYDFLDWVTGVAREHDIELLPEIHAEYSTQLKLAKRGYWIYDFVLPYMVLEALITGRARRLAGYLADRPTRQFTMLDCHDGLPVKPDLDGLVDSADARRVVDTCLERGGEVSRVHSDHHKAPDGFDVHQISGTLYSLLGEDDDALVAARAIQLFVPGVPQVYYVGLLAGANDREAFESTGDRRALNRHNYTRAEIDAALERPVVGRLAWLIRFRNEFPAFEGEFSLTQPSSRALRLTWRGRGAAECSLEVDVEGKESVVDYVDSSGGRQRRRL